MPALPIVTIVHPLAGQPPDEVKNKALGAVDEIIHVLTYPPESLAEEYKARYLQVKGLFKWKPLFD
ncbi:MAG: hypothetical protein HY730_03755 [Candidatus Tectomicrobia bacterium]|uniref:Uncharacterized protein n=1 Tax=Tectimicrobiota bacterium TaxID=2528274 RepID=A0A933GKE4_UNCTE|nr:hypothetical protein [Candidatus Tectomicrobia bacterium]